MRKLSYKELEEENKRQNRIFWFLFIGYCFSVLISCLYMGEIKTLQRENSELSNLNLSEGIEILRTNCGNEIGTVLISKGNPSGDGNYIFVEDCLNNGYCAYIYKPIEECLK